MDAPGVESPVVIIGAGIAGLSCAVYLKQAGIKALVVEATDGVGGRVRTDVVDGFRLDRGFQILLTAYPEAQRLLNYDDLDLKPFRSGALIRHQSEWLTLLNPFQEPLSAFRTLASSVGTVGDKLRIVDLIRRTQAISISELFQQTPTTTLAFLKETGFSDQIIERFFRPFFGGVFLEDGLTTSSNFFEFCFRMFFTGDGAIPAQGIGAIPNQLATRLSPDQIKLNSPVARIDGNSVHLTNGNTLKAGVVVLAVDAAQAAALLNRPAPSEQSFNQTTCTYFATGSDLSGVSKQKLLVLNTDRSLVVHNLAILSDVSPEYAPAGQTLVSVSTQGIETVNATALTEQVRTELTGWFGDDVKSWKHLRTYHIPQALPSYPADRAGTDAIHELLKLGENLYQCGDQTTYPSLNATIQTGRLVAEMIRKQ
ncbi:NAD(P)-binding protein [Spirosoma endbachense]|uniref:NAD(P)-binding protein n=2 Tax=Spirosoma endbachense TaxID=2666025 RepID=A0A6P1W9M8_9BACT|nr:NAD(P)-binding protein [Spirosoma endbachense]